MMNQGRVVAKLEFDAVAIPREGISINEARDKWLAANPENRVIDDGGRGDPRLLVARERTRMVAYELIPEATDNVTVEQAMQHMRNIGMDVRGVGPMSIDGNPTIIVAEKVNG